MSFFTRRRTPLILLAVSLLALALGVAVVGTQYGRRHLEQQLRLQLARNSDLVINDFEVRTNWRDFPHLTASLRHLTLTDTSNRRTESVLRIGRADARLQLIGLLRGRLQISRLALQDVVLRSRVDSRGRRWALHARSQPGPGTPPRLDFDLKALRLTNVRLDFRNDYKRNRLRAHIRDARLTARLHGGLLSMEGQLLGGLDTLRNRNGTLLANEPVQAWAYYRYSFERRQGTFRRTRLTLNGDTLHLSGTHTAPASPQPGKVLNLRVAGRQPLVAVLRAVLPPRLYPSLAGASSPSHAYVRYLVSGLSGPTTVARTALHFELRRAQLTWPDSTRRISRWNLRGVLDNGSAHAARTTSLQLRECSIFSSFGRLDMQLTVQDFTQPVISGWVRGRTDMAALATLVAPGWWQARRGAAELNLRLRGPLPAPAGQPQPTRPLSVRGTVTLRNAAFTLPDRGAVVSDLNVRVGLHDSLWQLNNLSGQVDGMRFRATATTTRLLEYFTGQLPSTRIVGTFEVDELRLNRVRNLLRPASRATAGHARATRAAADSSLLPPGLGLRIRLRCQRLVLPTDTVRQLAATVHHDGQRIRLTHLAAGMWGGQLRGQVSWPMAASSTPAPARFQLAMRFGTVEYSRVLRLITRKAERKGRRPAPPALSELLLASNGQATCEISTLRMPTAGEDLRQLTLSITKTGNALRMPDLRFGTTLGGEGTAAVRATFSGAQMTAANADLLLRYPTLNVQRLLLLLAGLKPTSGAARTDSAAAGAARQPRGSSDLLTDRLTARVRVQAGRVRYAALSGTDFRVTSHLQPGEARLDDCSLSAFGGQIRLLGRLQTVPSAGGFHPLQAQVQLRDIALPQLFGIAEALGFDVLGPENVRGSMDCAAAVRTELDSTFLPSLSRTVGFAKTGIQDLELLDVAALEQAFRFISPKRVNHLYFEPVSTQFYLERNRVLIPSLRLNSNLTDLDISGSYFLDGRANLYVGMSPLQTLLGNNERRVDRIQAGETTKRPARRLTYVNLRRAAGRRYAVRLFKQQEKEQEQAQLRQRIGRLLRAQPLDTALHLLRR